MRLRTTILLCASIAVATPDLFDVYVAGQSDTAGLNYTCFRIPSLVRTKEGDIIAFDTCGSEDLV